jgi:putative ABC transport system permease protein
VIDNVKAHQENGSPIWSTVYYKFYDIDQMNDFPIFEGEIDREKYESGNYVLATAIDEEGHSLYHVGDRVRIYEELPTVEGLVAAKGEGEQGVGNYYQSLPSREYEVMAVVGNRFEEEMYPREKLRTIDFLFPTEAMAKMSAEPELKLIAIDAYDLQQLNEIEEYVKEVLQHPGNEGKVEYRSVAEYNNSLNEFRLLFSLIGNGLALVIGMMAFGNFINNCISGIVERKEEFRTLKAIGMPRNQLLRILRYENLFTVLTAVIPAYILGQVISKFLIVKIADRLGWLKWNRSWIPGIVLMIVLIGISLIYPNRKTDLEEQWVKD